LFCISISYEFVCGDVAIIAELKQLKNYLPYWNISYI